MAKYSGAIGFAATELTAPDVYTERITERTYFGDILRSVRRSESDGQMIDSPNVSNQISIVADPYARENLFAMRYVTFMGCKWKISSVEAQFPRLLLTIGGVYHAQTED